MCNDDAVDALIALTSTGNARGVLLCTNTPMNMLSRSTRFPRLRVGDLGYHSVLAIGKLVLSDAVPAEAREGVMRGVYEGVGGRLDDVLAAAAAILSQLASVAPVPESVEGGGEVSPPGSPVRFPAENCICICVCVCYRTDGVFLTSFCSFGLFVGAGCRRHRCGCGRGGVVSLHPPVQSVGRGGGGAFPAPRFTLRRADVCVWRVQSCR